MKSAEIVKLMAAAAWEMASARMVRDREYKLEQEARKRLEAAINDLANAQVKYGRLCDDYAKAVAHEDI